MDSYVIKIQTAFQIGAEMVHVTSIFKMVIHVKYMMIAKIFCATKKNAELYSINFLHLIVIMLPDKMETYANFLKIVHLGIAYLIIAMEI